MNERKTKGLTNLNSDEKIIRDTCVSLARMYFSQFAAISCLIYIPNSCAKIFSKLLTVTISPGALDFEMEKKI